MTEEKKYICADCGTFSDTMDDCKKCGSVRVVLLSVLKEMFGEDYMKAFQE